MALPGSALGSSPLLSGSPLNGSPLSRPSGTAPDPQAAVAGASALGPFSEFPENSGSSVPLDEAQRARVALHIDALSELDGAELAGALDAILAPSSSSADDDGAAAPDVILAVILRAGRPMPPGLSSARRAQRAERAAEALEWIRAARAEPLRRALIRDGLASALETSSPAPELCIAAMRVVSQLDLVGHALAVARWLAPGDEARTLPGEHLPRLRVAAQAALFQLYGRWFEDSEAFEVQWEVLRGRSPEGTGRDELLSAIQEANGRALTLIEYAPSRLDHDLVNWASPAMRSDAVRAVGRAVAGGKITPDEARAMVSAALPAERSESALHARLATLVDLVQGDDPESAASAAVRDLVFAQGEAALTRSCEEIFVVIGALTRLSHAQGPGGDAGRSEVLRRATDLFRAAVERGEIRALDADAVQGAMHSLRDLVRSMDDPAIRATAGRPLATLVAPYVVGATPAQAPMRLRRAAAEIFALAADASDARALVTALRSAQAPELEYELLGALRSVIAVVEPGTPPAEEIIEELFKSAQDPGFDSRARALELLLSDDVAPALDAKARAAEARWIEGRLLTEPASELRPRLADLLMRIGDQASLRRLVNQDPDGDPDSDPSPSILDRFAAMGESSAQSASELAVHLSGSDPLLLSQAAAAIAGPVPLGASGHPLTPMRHMMALEVLLSGDPSTLPGTPWIARTAVRLRHTVPAQTASLMAAQAPAAQAPAARALAAHIEGLRDQEPTLAALAATLMEADRLRAAPDPPADPTASTSSDPTAPSPEDQERRISKVIQGFDAAAAEAPVEGWTRTALLFECVQLLRSLGRNEAALRRLEVLLQADFEANPSAIPSNAIRLFAELFRATAPAPEAPTPPELRTQRAALGLQLLDQLIRRPRWSTDSAGLRLADLESLILLQETAPNPTAPNLQSLQTFLSQTAASAAFREDLNAIDRARAAPVWQWLDRAAPKAPAPPPESDG